MPAKKRSTGKTRSKTSQATATHTHLSVAQKIGVIITILAGFSALAAGFGALNMKQFQKCKEYYSQKEVGIIKINQKFERQCKYLYTTAKQQAQNDIKKKIVEEKKPQVVISAEENTEHIFTAGSTNNAVYGAKIKAGEEDVVIQALQFSTLTDSGKPASFLKEIELLYQEPGAAMPTSISTTVSMNDGTIFFPNINIVIPKGEVAYLSLNAETLPSVNLQKWQINQPFYIQLDTGADSIKAKGSSSGNTAVLSGSTKSSTMKLVQTQLSQSFSKDPGKKSPYGIVAKNSEQVIAVVKMSNEANVGAYEAGLHDFRLKMQTSGFPVQSTTVNVYKNSVSEYSLLGSKTVLWTDSELSWSDAAFKDIQIPSGESYYVYVTADTTMPAIGANDTLCLALDESTQWDDGVATYNELSYDQAGYACITY